MASDPNITAQLDDFKTQLAEILKEIEEASTTEAAPTVDPIPVSSFDMKKFFDLVRESLFSGSLSSPQVQGIEAKIRILLEQEFPLSWAAYALATSYHETARHMLPVREGLNVTEAYRKAHFRYYPYYGRGDIQLTWLANYQRADTELNLNGALLKNLDLALDPDISAKIMTRGMKEGWFSKGNTLGKYLPDNEGTLAQFTQARHIINLMDRADLIAEYAIKFQTALKEAGYGAANNR